MPAACTYLLGKEICTVLTCTVTLSDVSSAFVSSPPPPQCSVVLFFRFSGFTFVGVAMQCPMCRTTRYKRGWFNVQWEAENPVVYGSTSGDYDRCKECWHRDSTPVPHVPARRPNDDATAKSLFGEMKQMLVWFKSCLLYTSPSPRDGLLSRMPSSA